MRGTVLRAAPTGLFSEVVCAGGGPLGELYGVSVDCSSRFQQRRGKRAAIQFTWCCYLCLAFGAMLLVQAILVGIPFFVKCHAAAGLSIEHFLVAQHTVATCVCVCVRKFLNKICADIAGHPMECCERRHDLTSRHSRHVTSHEITWHHMQCCPHLLGHVAPERMELVLRWREKGVRRCKNRGQEQGQGKGKGKGSGKD